MKNVLASCHPNRGMKWQKKLLIQKGLTARSLDSGSLMAAPSSDKHELGGVGPQSNSILLYTKHQAHLKSPENLSGCSGCQEVRICWDNRLEERWAQAPPKKETPMAEERPRNTSHTVVTGSHGDGEAMMGSKAEKPAGEKVQECERTWGVPRVPRPGHGEEKQKMKPRNTGQKWVMNALVCWPYSALRGGQNTQISFWQEVERGVVTGSMT